MADDRVLHFNRNDHAWFEVVAQALIDFEDLALGDGIRPALGLLDSHI